MDRTAYLRRIKQHLQTAYLLSEEKTESMLPIFFATLREHMNRLAHLAADGDMEQLAKASHAVKGALLNIGLMDLAEPPTPWKYRAKTAIMPLTTAP